MKRRTALKLWHVVDTPEEARYRKSTLKRAYTVYLRSPQAKAIDDYWASLMTTLGVEGRVHLLKEHAPGLAFDLLMREGP